MDLISNDQVKAAQELLVKAGEILREEQEKDKNTARRFNVFNALGVERAELAHSRFLKSLLDPNGIHAQKDLFLRTFLRDVLREEAEELDLERSEVGTEVSIDKGRLDIRVILPDKQIIIIENKVDAGEGEEQLKRYRSCLQKELPAKSGRPHQLVFLTPDGRPPALCSPTEVKCVSYRKDIADWLDRLKDKVPHRLEVVLSQYVNLWRARPMNQDLITLLQDPRNLETAERISKAVEKIKGEAKGRFLVRVQEDLKRRLHQSNLSENWDVLHTPWIGTYAGVGIFWRNRKLMEGQKEKLWQFAVHCEAQSGWTKVIIGICRGAEITQKDRLDERETKLFGKLSEKYINLRPSTWWTGFLDLPDLLGGTIGLKSFINELLGGEHQIHQIAEQVAKALWEIFETCRIELEGLNKDYPVPYLDGFRTCREPLTGAITWASQTGHE